MGVQKVGVLQSRTEMQDFVRNLLNDVKAFEYMLENDWFESDKVRIGAEQEMCLVHNKTFKPAKINMEVLGQMGDAPWCVTELAKFNLETNLSPRVFEKTCLSELEAENVDYLGRIQKILDGHDASIALCGILPTLRKSDLDIENLTPKDRYFALMSAIQKHLIGSSFELRVEGVDELLVKHDSPLLEACNTSFQVHLQVAPKDFVKMYNIAQTLAAACVSVAANSPLVFGRRLWHESRIALFQQSLDTRSTSDHMRERSPRVHFGNEWLKGSILNIYKEDIARYRVLLASGSDEDAFESIAKGVTPKLKHLLTHNSTVYRWNRPCYGISENGKPHLRIENRVMPSGPSVVDEVANAAFWLGAMIGMSLKYDDITTHISFADVRDNFLKAAKFGIDTTFTWLNDRKVTAKEWIVDILLPIAEDGLKHQKVAKADIDKYLGIIRDRINGHCTGARWALRAYTQLKESVSMEESLTIITAMTVKNQQQNKPVHTWDIPTINDLENWVPSKLKVEEFMSTDLFTCDKDDPIELVADIMDWRKIRYMPVENAKGELVGLISSRLLLRYFSKRNAIDASNSTLVENVMIKKPITVNPEATIHEAMHLLKVNKIGCLPVVKGKDLVGIITEMDFLRITGRLMDILAK